MGGACGPTGASGRLGSVSLVVLLGSALLQAVTLAIHLQDSDMMGEPVEQSAGQAL